MSGKGRGGRASVGRPRINRAPCTRPPRSNRLEGGSNPIQVVERNSALMTDFEDALYMLVLAATHEAIHDAQPNWPGWLERMK